MLLKFKNKHICWCMEPVWSDVAFDYKFKTHINQLISDNSNNEFEQSVEITGDNLVSIYRAVSKQPEGVAAAINKEIKELLLPQLLLLSNNDDNNPNEAYSALKEIAASDAEDLAARESVIEKSKNNILK